MNLTLKLFNKTSQLLMKMERRSWTPLQDQILKELYEKGKVNKWSLIARQMEEEHRLPLRTGKQCRERYINHISMQTRRQQWKLEQQQELFKLHDQIGNRWAIIAQRLSGRTDNSVKNHFFAKIRKSMRKMNKIIKKRFKKELKMVKLNVLYKILEASQQRFKDQPLCTIQVSKNASCKDKNYKELKNTILQYALQEDQAIQELQFFKLVDSIDVFSKNYKRKPKNLRRITSSDITYQKGSQHDIDLSQLQSQSKSQQGEQDIIYRSQTQNHNFSIKSQQESVGNRIQLRSKGLKAKEKKHEIQNVDDLLEKQGLLQQQIGNEIPLLNAQRRQSESQISSINLNRQVFYFDQSSNNRMPLPFTFNNLTKNYSQEDESFWK